MILAANFKTNLNRTQTQHYLETLEAYVQSIEATSDVVVFPAISSLVPHAKSVTVGAQNCYPAYSGAYTGEIGVSQLEEFGIQTLLIGHSERREILGESQAVCAKKFAFFKELGFRIIYCVGEPLSVREQGESALLEYIKKEYEGIDTEYENLIIAYEPIWAIGTGLTPTLEQISQLHQKLKTISSAPLLYGGSVKVANVEEILRLDGVDGVLVGGASLDVNDFSKMIEIAEKIKNKD